MRERSNTANGCTQHAGVVVPLPADIGDKLLQMDRPMAGDGQIDQSDFPKVPNDYSIAPRGVQKTYNSLAMTAWV
jgi:hypothetical protein